MGVSCIACGSGKVANLGVLPNFTSGPQAQPQLTAALKSSLYACLNCTLRFRAPMPTQEELIDYYSGLSGEDWWQYETERQVWFHIKEILRVVPEHTILDVGCFRGDFLKFLGEGWQRFGVEPSADAKRVAQSRGIEIIGHDIDVLKGESRRFGAITMIDVIEHLPKPLDALRILSRLLLPGGKLLIFTGNTDAWTWRFAKLQYWYCAMPEHVAFFRPAWFRWAAPKLDCSVESVRRLAYNPSALRTRLDESLKNIACAAYHRLDGLPVLSNLLSRLPITGRVASWESSWWTSARDHILVTMTKFGQNQTL